MEQSIDVLIKEISSEVLVLKKSHEVISNVVSLDMNAINRRLDELKHSKEVLLRLKKKGLLLSDTLQFSKDIYIKFFISDGMICFSFEFVDKSMYKLLEPYIGDEKLVTFVLQRLIRDTFELYELKNNKHIFTKFVTTSLGVSKLRSYFEDDADEFEQFTEFFNFILNDSLIKTLALSVLDLHLSNFKVLKSVQ